jgi:OCT family organic cation transporter-like MFS transporter 4/5
MYVMGGALYFFLQGDHWRPLPLLIYGALALCGGLLSLLLPETLNKKLPDTIEEGEVFGLQ